MLPVEHLAVPAEARQRPGVRLGEGPVPRPAADGDEPVELLRAPEEVDELPFDAAWSAFNCSQSATPVKNSASVPQIA